MQEQEKAPKKEEQKKSGFAAAPGKAAQFTAAAAAGVAGNMAAEAINLDTDQEELENEVNTPSSNHQSGYEEPDPEPDFDPNGIMIEEVDEIEEDIIDPEEQHPQEPEPEEVEGFGPITQENITHGASAEIEEIDIVTEPEICDIDPDDIDPHVGDCMYGGPDGWEDPTTDILAQNEDEFDIDFANDIV